MNGSGRLQSLSSTIPPRQCCHQDLAFENTSDKASMVIVSFFPKGSFPKCHSYSLTFPHSPSTFQPVTIHANPNHPRPEADRISHLTNMCILHEHHCKIRSATISTAPSYSAPVAKASRQPCQNYRTGRPCIPHFGYKISDTICPSCRARQQKKSDDAWAGAFRRVDDHKTNQRQEQELARRLAADTRPVQRVGTQKTNNHARQQVQELAYCLDANDAWARPGYKVGAQKSSMAAKPVVRRKPVARSRPAPRVVERKGVGYWTQEDEEPQKKSCCVIM